MYWIQSYRSPLCQSQLLRPPQPPLFHLTFLQGRNHDIAEQFACWPMGSNVWQGQIDRHYSTVEKVPNMRNIKDIKLTQRFFDNKEKMNPIFAQYLQIVPCGNVHEFKKFKTRGKNERLSELLMLLLLLMIFFVVNLIVSFLQPTTDVRKYY